MNRMNLFDADEKLIHYEGELGIFDYDPEEFEVRYFFWGNVSSLLWNGKVC